MVEGLFEQYCVMDQDVRNDSAMECTVLSLAIANAKTMLADRGLRLPEFLSTKYDNTGREGNNPIVAKWMSWTQHRGVVRQVQDGSGEPGHSHDAQDQRFSVISANLARCKILHTYLDVVNVVRNTLQQTRGARSLLTSCQGRGTGRGYLSPWGSLCLALQRPLGTQTCASPSGSSCYVTCHS